MVQFDTLNPNPRSKFALLLRKNTNNEHKKQQWVNIKVVAEEAKATEEETVEAETKEVERLTSAEEDKDFDWEIYEMGTEEYTKDERSDLEKDYESALSTIDTDQVLDGSVVSITDREVIVKSEFFFDDDAYLWDFWQKFIAAERGAWQSLHQLQLLSVPKAIQFIFCLGKWLHP